LSAVSLPTASSGEPPDDAVDCSVLVPVFNEQRYIEQTVAAMRRQRFDGVLEFVFADGGSTDRTRESLDALAREDSRIRVFENPNRSVSSGLNVALAHARGRWVARMDAHTEYPADYLALGVRRLEQGSTPWVSGPQVPKGDNAVSRAVALALGSPLGRGGSRKWGGAGAGDSAGAEFELDSGVFAGVWARATLLEHGGWDERWLVNEDSEMAGRFFARGERLICIPAMAAQYAPRRSLRGLWRQYRIYGEYRERTSIRHPSTMRRSHLLAPTLVLDAAVSAWGPRPLRPMARFGLDCYAALVLAAQIRALATDRPKDALLVGAVLPIMHLGHGVGFLYGVLRYGPPVAALASVAGLEGVAAAFAGEPDPVFNPSLGVPIARPAALSDR
jgi:succinoglycan biosynthesis protein ExoA